MPIKLPTSCGLPSPGLLLVLLDMTTCQGTHPEACCPLLCFSDTIPADLCSLSSSPHCPPLADTPVATSHHTAAIHLRVFGTKPFPPSVCLVPSQELMYSVKIEQIETSVPCLIQGPQSMTPQSCSHSPSSP